MSLNRKPKVPERFFHVYEDKEPLGTVFMRRVEHGWDAAVALLDPRDQFNRMTGRLVALKKYFKEPKKRIIVKSDEISGEVCTPPSYADAQYAIAIAQADRRSKRCLRNRNG